MSEERVDAQTLAALLDGTLSAAEREAVLMRIMRSDESYEALVGATAVLRALEAGETAGVTSGPEAPPGTAEHAGGRVGLPAEGGTVVAAGRAARARRRLRGGLLVAVSALAASVLVIAYLRDHNSTFAALDRVSASRAAVADVLTSSVQRVSAGARRGPSAAPAPRARAFRLGAESVDLELALRLRDTVAARVIATSLRRIAQEVEGGQPVALRVDALLRDGAASPRTREQVARELRSLTGDALPWFDLGAWAETARLAARGGDVRFFSSEGGGRRELSRLLGALGASPASETPEAATAVGRLRALEDARVTAAALPSITSALDSVVTVLGR